jgi:hypothetical protein
VLAEQAEEHTEISPEINPEDLGDREGSAATTEWPSSADDGWRAAQEVAQAVPGDYTSAGLPKRQPRAALLPGSVTANGTRAANGPDADVVRDRLNSFQRGVRKGRGNNGSNGSNGAVNGTAVATATGGRIEHGFQWENE